VNTLNFGVIAVGNTSLAKSVTLTNYQNTPVNFASILPSGDFAVASNTCGSTIAARASCTVGLAFSPTAKGARVGALTITDNAANSPQTVSLTGTGSSPVIVSPLSLTFANLTVGTTAATQTVTLTNRLNTPLAVSAVVATGDFAVASNTCGSSVGAGLACTIGVSFTPTSVGTRTGTLAISYSALGSPSPVSLTGYGNASGLTSITVTPANSVIPRGTTQQFIATGQFNSGSVQNLTASAAWISSSPGVVTISNTSSNQNPARA